MPRFAANLGHLFTDRPLLKRIDDAAKAGFRAIELQYPYDVPASDVKAAIQRNKLVILGLNTPPGEGDAQFGFGALPGRERDFEAAFARALDYIVAIGGSAIHCMTGVVPPERVADGERTFIANLTRAADLAAPKRITLFIEPINTIDRPNYFLNRLEQAADIVTKVGRPNVKIQFDFYHMQVVGGDLIRRLEKYMPMIGHLQCGSVPGRHEPDEGEINFRHVFEAVDRLGYSGWIGAEYTPRFRTEEGLGWAHAYGVVPR